jgi:hypothetical protein
MRGQENMRALLNHTAARLEAARYRTRRDFAVIPRPFKQRIR